MVGLPRFKRKSLETFILILLFLLVNQTSYNSGFVITKTSENRIVTPNANVHYLILSSLPLDLSNTAVTYFIPGGDGEILLSFSRFGPNPEDYELLLYSSNWNTPLKSDSYLDDNKIEISHIIDTQDEDQALNALWKVEIRRTGDTSDSTETWSLDLTYPEPWLDFQSQNVNKTDSKILQANINTPGVLNIVLRDLSSALTDNINSQICSPCNNLDMYLFPPDEDASGISYDASAISVSNPERIRSFKITANNIGFWHLRVDLIVGTATNFLLELGFIPDEKSTATTTITTQIPTSNDVIKTSCLGTEVPSSQIVLGCTSDEWTVIGVIGGIVIGVLGFVWKFVLKRGKKN